MKRVVLTLAIVVTSAIVYRSAQPVMNWLEVRSSAEKAVDLSAQEAALFAVDDRLLFAEEPPLLRRYQLLSLSRTADGEIQAQIRSLGKSRSYRVGDQLEGSEVLVSEVMTDGVLLNHQGSYSLLWRNGVQDAGEELQIQPIPWRALSASSASEAPQLVDLRAVDQVTRLASDYRRRLYQRPLSLVGAVNVQFKRTQAGHRFLQLAPGSDAEAFELLGLADGDELVGINGVRFDDDEAMTTLYQQLVDMPHMVATLRRGGQTVVVMLSLDS